MQCDLAQPGQPSKSDQACIGDALAFIKLHLLECRHAAQDLQGAVGDLRQAGVVLLQPESLLPGVRLVRAGMKVRVVSEPNRVGACSLAADRRRPGARWRSR